MVSLKSNAVKNLILLLLLGGAVPCASAAYKGRVVVDVNHNHESDKADAPLKGVVVTDGQHTVMTDKDGRFSLPGYTKTRFITVTTPSGYAAVDKYYIPVAVGTTSYDFLLEKNERSAGKDHSFLHITDTEISGRGASENWVSGLRDYVKNQPDVAFLVHTGDICYENGLISHIKIVNKETMHCPVYYVVGNHDLVKGDYGEQLFESIYGPSWYSFDAGNVHYVVTPMAGGDYKPSYTVDEVYQWLKNDLAMKAPGKALVIFNHDVLSTGNELYFGPDEAHRLNLRDYDLKAWVYGHFHVNYVRNQAGVYTICSAPPDKGGIDHSVGAFREIKFTDTTLQSMDLHYCFVNARAVIASPANGNGYTVNGKVPVSVNAYKSGTNVTKVTAALKASGVNAFGNPQPLAQQTDWNWSIDLPVSGDSAHLQVTAYFSDGTQVVTITDFKVQKQNRAQPGGNWTNLLNDVAHAGNAGVNLQAPLQLSWMHNLGSNVFMSSPIVADKTVFVATVDENYKQRAGVTAMDAATGVVKWKFTTRNSVKNSIAWDDNTVFAQDAEGYLYALDAGTGKLRWERKLAMNGYPYLEDGLIAKAGNVYAGTGKALGAYSAKNGSPLWTNQDWNYREGTTTTLTLAGNVLTTGVQWGALYGNDATTGKKLWEINSDGMRNRGASTTLYDGKLYVISEKSLFIIDPASGNVLTRKEYPGMSLDVTSTPLITDREIIFGTADKGMVALNKTTFGVQWQTQTERSLIFTAPYTTLPFASVETSPVYSNGVVYFGASDGCLYGLKAATGEIVWKYDAGAPVFSSVALSGNCLYAADFAGNVYCFSSAL